MLYNEERPKTFDDVKGQGEVTNNLKNQSKQRKFFSNYIFHGQFGAGKTSISRVLSKAFNCLNPEQGNPCLVCKNCLAIEENSSIDFSEINAANNNSIEDIRSIIEQTQYKPIDLLYKVYIIDEVHMLSNSAFNALLKIFEEPPEYVKFILCTTEKRKIPGTILSRSAKYEIKRISEKDIEQQVNNVSKKHGYTIEKDAAVMIAKYAKGSMRDALSILEQSMGEENTITAAYVNKLLGVESFEACFSLLELMATSQIPQVITEINRLYSEGKDFSLLINDMLEIIADLVVYRNTKAIEAINNTESYRNRLVTNTIPLEKLFYFSDELLKVKAVIKEDNQKSTLVVQFVTLIKHSSVSYNGILERLERLESGAIVANVESQENVTVQQVKEIPNEEVQSIQSTDEVKEVDNMDVEERNQVNESFNTTNNDTENVENEILDTSFIDAVLSTEEEVLNGKCTINDSGYESDLDELDLPALDIPEEYETDFNFTFSSDDATPVVETKSLESTDSANTTKLETVHNENICDETPSDESDIQNNFCVSADMFDSFFSMMPSTSTDIKKQTQTEKKSLLDKLKKSVDQLFLNCLDGSKTVEQDETLIITTPLFPLAEIMESYVAAYNLEFVRVIYDRKAYV